jgi:hypothetical protein
MQKTTSITLLFALSGCLGVSEPPALDETSGSEVALSGLLPTDAALVGIAITPEGKRYVLDQRSGLYELGEHSARLIVDTKVPTGRELTDVVALDADRFALTAENDGFLFNLTTTQLSSYFCYLPSVPPGGGTDEPLSISQSLRNQGIDVTQRTESVAFNPETRQLFAQPRTWLVDTGTVVGSELFVFTEQGGQPVQVFGLAEGFEAGGMVVLPGSRLVLGAGNRIYEADSNGSITLVLELEASVNVTGMARDPAGAVWYVDGASRRLVRIDDRF